MKYCKGCDKTKKLRDFNKDSRYRDGLKSRCKVCAIALKIALKRKYRNIKMKTCTKCKQTKALTEFGKRSQNPDGLFNQCKVCKNIRSQKWKQNNREKVNAYYQNNREKILKKSKRPEAKKRRNARRKERLKTDPQFKIRSYLGSRLWRALNGISKSASTMTLVGCSISHLKDHLEKQFLPGMTWKNYGPVWHVDHMMPCDSFDLSDPEQQRQCFHYTNLQPLWASENMSKADTILYNRVWNGCRWINNV